MKVTLISHLPSEDAVNLLIYTKLTRLTQGEETRDKVAQMSSVEKMNELVAMSKTIPSSWEFVDYVFEIKDVTRAFTHQFVRTRTGSYAQQTMRMLEKQDFTYEMGPTIDDAEKRGKYVTCMEHIQDAYDDLIALGVAVEDARGVLPTNIHTNIIAKFNLRTLAEMARSRGGLRTQSEYRDVLEGMIGAVLAVHPWAKVFLQPEHFTPILDAEDAIKEIEQHLTDPNVSHSDLRALIIGELTSIKKSIDQIRKAK